MKTLRLTLILLFAISPVHLISQSSTGTASLREYSRTFLTYPFGDPNPVARTGKIYPYFRFDGFSTKGINRDWKIVELENEWVKVLIAPEIGGKVLGAIEKSTGQEFLYLNKVVKFRDISMRGAWTSGGIEFNFGSIGHAPTTASPVDYLVRSNPDGSVSCWIGAMDLTSRTEWRVEIRLPKDKAYFETNIFWYNPMDLSSSKYHWATAAADAAPDLKYYFPGDHFIGHDGDASPWPVLKDGRNISNYAENNFGSDHSYHVLGTYSDFFAGFYSTRNFGFGHWNDYPEKLGKKIWIWSLSPQGDIWTDLLTDRPGNMQYTEIQTGILFNQEGAGSTYTPFKHMSFPSNSSERFTEYWFPVVGTRGVTEVTRAGVLFVDDKTMRPKDQETVRLRDQETVRQGEQGLANAVIPANAGISPVIRFCPLEFVKDTMLIGYSDGSSQKISLDLKPLELYTYTPGSGSQPSAVGGHLSSVRIGSRLHWTPTTQADRNLDRPVASPQFDWNSVQGLCMKATEFSRQREYSQARDYFRKTLAKDPRYIPALSGLAEEYIRILKPKLAEELLQTALGLDTYDPKANYLYGIVKKSEEVKKVEMVEVVEVVEMVEPTQGFYQALEAFGIAARSMEYRSAAYAQMAEIYLILRKFDQVFKYTALAQDYNRYSINAIQIEILANRLSGQKDQAKSGTDKLLAIDPLNHFARFERYLIQETADNLADFTSLIRNEFPEQTYLELAIFYAGFKRTDDALRLLRMAPEVPEVSYWRGYLSGRTHGSAPTISTTSTISTISTTSTTSTKFSFPWRPETLRVIEMAEANTPDWRNRYYMGLMRWNLDDSARARDLFKSCKDEPAEWHFYLTRAKLFAGFNDEMVLQDLQRANALESSEWRTWQALTGYYMGKRAWGQALETARKGSQKIPGHMILEFERAKAELYNHQYDKCLDILGNLILLPAEGAREGHEIYRSALILRALDNFVQKKYARALKDLEEARKWPESLGVGKPLVTDERIENYLAGVIYLQTDRPEEGAKYLNEVINWTAQHKPAWDTPYVVAALSQVLLNREPEGDRYLNDWMKVQPASALMLWSVAAYSINPSAAAKALTRLGWKPEETPWGLGDAQFPLVYEVVRKVVVR